MVDGGGCHPRDQIAMSWLAEDASLSLDVFGNLAHARDNQTARQANLLMTIAQEKKLPICILGWSYKPETNLTVGSPARLLGSFLEAGGFSFRVYDPWVFPEQELPSEPHIFFIATNHPQFSTLTPPPNSVVIDPWGIFNSSTDKIGRAHV